MDTPRIVTEKEIFDNLFLTKWKACMDMAQKELCEREITLKKDFKIQDLLAATAQLYIQWNIQDGYIKREKISKQAEIDKRFGKQ